MFIIQLIQCVLGSCRMITLVDDVLLSQMELHAEILASIRGCRNHLFQTTITTSLNLNSQT